jgi:hypothetical protein
MSKDDIKQYFEKRINLEIQLIELFILTVTAELVIISTSDYKKIVISVLINIVALCYLIGMLIFELNKKSKEISAKAFLEIGFVYVPLELKDLIPLGLYLVSTFIMGIIILIPLLK